MKVLFLDIDGVVCLHEEGVVNWGDNTADDVFDEQCCRRLKEIIDRTGCKLVLSSFWRLEEKDIFNMLEQFRPFGITASDFHGKTPIMVRRGEEIKSYLAQYPEITSFVAVDDEDFANDDFPASKIVLTEIERGITEPIKNQIIEKLLETYI